MTDTTLRAPRHAITLDGREHALNITTGDDGAVTASGSFTAHDTDGAYFPGDEIHVSQTHGARGTLDVCAKVTGFEHKRGTTNGAVITVKFAGLAQLMAPIDFEAASYTVTSTACPMAQSRALVPASLAQEVRALQVAGIMRAARKTSAALPNKAPVVPAPVAPTAPTAPVPVPAPARAPIVPPVRSAAPVRAKRWTAGAR